MRVGRYLEAADQHTRGRLRERRWRTDARAFYAPFTSNGDLVFDVGANLGSRAAVFLDLGARVVAVEPQPKLAARIRRRFGSRVCVEEVALGAEPGRAALRLAAAHTIASLSDDWVAAVRSSGRFAEYDWAGEVDVEVSTLDALIARHGEPVFVKVDVEGFEPQVLAGLSAAVRGLSFEFTPELATNAEACIARLAELGPYEFNFVRGLELELVWPDWIDERGVIARLAGEDWGDVYARARR